jgi:hypothetical protein
MAKFNQREVEEINAVIAEIAKKAKPKMEIGGRDKTVLNAMLATSKVEKEVLFFKCRREHSDAIISHFVNNEKLTRSKFSSASQSYIFLIPA